MEATPGSSEALPQMLRTPTQTTRTARLVKIGSYKLGKKLGSGNFATVRIAKHEVAKTKVAVKIMDRSQIDAENLLKIEREIQILQHLRHPHIVKLYEVIRTDTHLLIVTELVRGGEIFDLITFHGRQPEKEARRIFQQLCSAVAYCHGNGVVHRDLKAENILLDKAGNVKLIDFGFANYQKPSALLSTWCGSPPYAAPELLLAQPYDGHLSDVWSLGVMLFILVSAEFPFQGGSVDNLKIAVLGDALNIPFYVSVECADLLRKMLTVKPEKRATLQQVMQHRWFIQEIPQSIKLLLDESRLKTQGSHREFRSASSGTLTKNLDPTVLLYMQQHTIWPEEKIGEAVLMQNYESPIFATYSLLNDKLDKLKEADMSLLADDQPRRGSRGSIISGKAKVESEPTATIPAHHLAQLNLSMSSDNESDDSSESNDYESKARLARKHPLHFQLQPDGVNIDEDWLRNEQRRHTLCASGQIPLPGAFYGMGPQPPLNLQQQQLIFMQHQLHQQNLLFMPAHSLNPAIVAPVMEMASHGIQEPTNSLLGSHTANFASGQSPTTMAGLMCLRNGLIDYSRMMKLPNSQERRASANEALLGLNGYAHLLASAQMTGFQPNSSVTSKRMKNVSSPMTPQPETSSKHSRPSVEEEGAQYLSRQGTHKRNTVHGATMPTTSMTPTALLQQNLILQQQQQLRYARTPYAKQHNGNERRSSWASPTNQALNQQQFSRLENLYAQSLKAAVASNGSGNLSATADQQLSSIQQLQLDFQRLKASTEKGGLSSGSSNSNIRNVNTPRISITDENNKPFVATSFSPVQGGRGAGLTSGLPAQPETASTAQFDDTTNKVKFVFIPVPPNVAVDRIHRFVRENDMVCEVRQSGPDNSITEVRVATKTNTVVSLMVHKMAESQNISKTEFFVIQGDQLEAEQLRILLMAAFNEVR